eukprot:Awhi_evm1s5899
MVQSFTFLTADQRSDLLRICKQRKSVLQNQPNVASNAISDTISHASAPSTAPNPAPSTAPYPAPTTTGDTDTGVADVYPVGTDNLNNSSEKRVEKKKLGKSASSPFQNASVTTTSLNDNNTITNASNQEDATPSKLEVTVRSSPSTLSRKPSILKQGGKFMKSISKRRGSKSNIIESDLPDDISGNSIEVDAKSWKAVVNSAVVDNNNSNDNNDIEKNTNNNTDSNNNIGTKTLSPYDNGINSRPLSFDGEEKNSEYNFQAKKSADSLDQYASPSIFSLSVNQLVVLQTNQNLDLSVPPLVLVGCLEFLFRNFPKESSGNHKSLYPNLFSSSLSQISVHNSELDGKTKSSSSSGYNDGAKEEDELKIRNVINKLSTLCFDEDTDSEVNFQNIYQILNDQCDFNLCFRVVHKLFANMREPLLTSELLPLFFHLTTLHQQNPGSSSQRLQPQQHQQEQHPHNRLLRRKSSVIEEVPIETKALYSVIKLLPAVNQRLVYLLMTLFKKFSFANKALHNNNDEHNNNNNNNNNNNSKNVKDIPAFEKEFNFQKACTEILCSLAASPCSDNNDNINSNNDAGDNNNNENGSSQNMITEEASAPSKFRRSISLDLYLHLDLKIAQYFGRMAEDVTLLLAFSSPHLEQPYDSEILSQRSTMDQLFKNKYKHAKRRRAGRKGYAMTLLYHSLYPSSSTLVAPRSDVGENDNNNNNGSNNNSHDSSNTNISTRNNPDDSHDTEKENENVSRLVVPDQPGGGSKISLGSPCSRRSNNFTLGNTNGGGNRPSMVDLNPDNIDERWYYLKAVALSKVVAVTPWKDPKNDTETNDKEKENSTAVTNISYKPPILLAACVDYLLNECHAGHDKEKDIGSIESEGLFRIPGKLSAIIDCLRQLCDLYQQQQQTNRPHQRPFHPLTLPKNNTNHSNINHHHHSDFPTDKEIKLRQFYLHYSNHLLCTTYEADLEAMVQSLKANSINTHLICAVLSRYLRDLPDPLLTAPLLPYFESVVQDDKPQLYDMHCPQLHLRKIKQVQFLLSLLPVINKVTVLKMLTLVKAVRDAKNKMSCSNLDLSCGSMFTGLRKIELSDLNNEEISAMKKRTHPPVTAFLVRYAEIFYSCLDTDSEEDIKSKAHDDDVVERKFNFQNSKLVAEMIDSFEVDSTMKVNLIEYVRIFIGLI